MPSVSDERKASRYDAIVATFVGVLALCVSAYTAYMQRQQVRAQVWPILEYTTSNDPDLRFAVANKGVGPALIKHVIVSVDGEPLTLWKDVLVRIMGPGPHLFSQSTIGDRVIAAGETLDILTPRTTEGAALTVGPAGTPGDLLNRGRARVGVEICFCSTLGDCWTLVDVPGKPANTIDTRRCPAPSEHTFKQ